MNNENTTPRPWVIYREELQEDFTKGFYIGEIDGEKEHVAYCCEPNSHDNGVSEANAELIVKTVNAYDSLKAKADMFDELKGVIESLLGSMENSARNGFLESGGEGHYFYNELKGNTDEIFLKAKELTE